MSEVVAVLGYGVTGRSAARHLRAQGYAVCVLDTRAQPDDFVPLEDVEYRFGEQEWPQLDVGRAVVSPGLSLQSCIIKGAQAANVEVISDIDLFFEQVDAPVVGITGTNGKSTVTSLVGHLLQQQGLACAVGGNLGTPALDLIEDDLDLCVLELSSFQLERSRLQQFAAASVLNLSEDHLDQHQDMQSYRLAKLRIYEQAQVCVFNRQDAATRPPQIDSPRVISFGDDQPQHDKDWGLTEAQGETWLTQGANQMMPIADLPFSGQHNVLNALAASALVSDWMDIDAIAQHAKSYIGLAHRYALVGRFDGVTYINDSKATNVGATLAALSGFEDGQQVVLIAGGDAKGADLSPLVAEFQRVVRAVICLGQDALEVATIAERANVRHIGVQDMHAAVMAARETAVVGDTVLLAPACASIDMFDNYAQRGEQFANAVQALANDAGGRHA